MTTTLIRPTRVSDRAFGRSRRDDPLDRLSPRELEVLALMAEGRSNRAIGERLAVGLKTVECHVSRVFTKLGLHEDRHENRRVLAVLAFLGRDTPRCPQTRSGLDEAGPEGVADELRAVAHAERSQDVRAVRALIVPGWRNASPRGAT